MWRMDRYVRAAGVQLFHSHSILNEKELEEKSTRSCEPQ